MKCNGSEETEIMTSVTEIKKRIGMEIEEKFPKDPFITKKGV